MSERSRFSSPVRIAMLSFAHYHANFWVETFCAQPDTRVAAVWDDDGDRGREAAQRFGVPFEPDLDAAIGVADAVAICCETSRHADLVERAAAAGRAILCEKPLAADLAGADRIARAVGNSGVLFMQSFPKRLDPVSHELRKLVDDGGLGQIHLVRVRHGHGYGLTTDFKTRWYARRALGGGGALLDEGVHGADLLNWLFGRPQSVVATTTAGILGLEVEDGATAIYSYESGMRAELTSSFLFVAADSSIEVYGTKGSALVSAVDLASRDITHDGFMRSYVDVGGERRWRVHDITPQFKLGRFHHQNAIAFTRCLLGDGVAPPASVAEGRAALEMIVKAYEAARTGQRQYF